MNSNIRIRDGVLEEKLDQQQGREANVVKFVLCHRSHTKNTTKLFPTNSEMNNGGKISLDAGKLNLSKIISSNISVSFYRTHCTARLTLEHLIDIARFYLGIFLLIGGSTSIINHTSSYLERPST